MRNTSLIFSSLFVAVSFVTVLLGCNSDKKETESSSDSLTTSGNVLFLNESDSRLNDRNFEQVPAVVSSADGKQVFVAWYSGGAAPGPGNYVTLSVSDDGGNNWKNDQLVVYPEDPNYRFFDPALWRDKNNQLHLFYGSAKDSLLWDGFGGVNEIEINWDGSKIAHSQSKRISDGVMSNKPIYLASKDQALFPIYIDKPLTADSSGKVFPKNGAFIMSVDYLKSDDLSSASLYSSIKIDEEIRIHDEPQLVQISEEGSFLAMVRTTKGIYYTTSADYGKTWNEVQPFTASGPTTSSRFYLGKLASGNLLLVSNSSTTRNNMTAFLSKDGGKTWPSKILLDARENVSYPDADQSADGNIHVVFDRDRTGAKDILYCRFTEADLINGDDTKVFKKRVNK